MSDTEYGRLAEKLGEIATDIGVIKARLETYNDNCAMLIKHDKDIELIKSNCQAIQDSKKIRSVRWGDVKGAVIGGVLVALIMLVIDLITRFGG